MIERIKKRASAVDSSPMRRLMVVSLLVVVGAMATACQSDDTAERVPADAFASLPVVTPVPVFTAPPTTVPPTMAAPTAAPATVPPEQITSCVDATKYGAFLGDADASARWNSAGQSDPMLAEACTEIGRSDPAALAAMHWDWTAAQAAITASPEPPAPPAVDCDPSYPAICIPTGASDINCGDITDRRFAVLQPDPHGFDGEDQDGIGCESD